MRDKYITKEGVIQSNGMVLSDDGIVYEPDMIHQDTIILAVTSWSRMNIKDVEGRKVIFTVYTPKNSAFNFKLI